MVSTTLSVARAAAGALGRLAPVALGRRFGIVAHLVVAFLAVGALAVAANLFAVYGTVFVTQAPRIVERLVYVPVQLPPPPVPVAVPEPEAPPPLDTSTLRLALDELEQAVHQRVATGIEADDQRLDAALDHVAVRSAGFARAASTRVPRPRLLQLDRATGALLADARELRRLADAPRHLVAEYQRHFEQMEARMADSLERAWRIFGRVIARESLVELNLRLGEIRRNLGELDATRAGDESVAQLPVVEAAFRESLEKRAPGLADSQGEAWVARMRADHDLLVAARTALAEACQGQSVLSAQFAQKIAALEAEAAAMAAATSRHVTKPVETTTRPVSGAEELSGPSPAPAPVAVAVPTQPVPAATETRQLVAPSDTSRPLAAISVGVLLFLAALSILMAWRVIRPVRALVDASRRLSEGRLNARVPGGGIRELDTLGESFNRMAECLAEARAASQDYQELLESRVRERTRQLQHLAEHDPLTELPNRRQLFSRLDAALADARAQGRVVGVMILDLDNFKNINDTMGHAYGDRVLQAVAQRLDAVVSESGFSARQGGDEFTIVCRAARGADEVVALGEAILRAFQEPLAVEGADLSVSASLGIASFPSDADDPEALLRAADAALFRAKALGRHRLSVFSPDLLETVASRFRTEQGLRHALEHGEFELAFQPEVDAATLRVPLLEALLRWRLPDGRLASPADFLSVAEDSGLIVEISDWVLKSAVAAAAAWRRDGWPDVRVAVNCSPRQVAGPEFSARLFALLEGHRLPAHCIEIELTEEVLQTGEATIETLHTLRGRGIGIALDDFGTGYSTLASLERLPFTRVKLDRSLVARIDTVPRSLAIAQTIIDLCRRLGLEITAEGVERPEQLDLLARARGIFVQGYLLSPPLAQRDVRREIGVLPSRLQALLIAAPSSRDDQGAREERVSAGKASLRAWGSAKPVPMRR